MDAPSQAKGLQFLQERYGDPILTGLTVLLLVMMFVVAPLQAADVIAFEAFGLVVAVAMVLGVLVMSRSPIAFILISVAVAMNGVGAVLRLHRLSTFDVYLVSAAWLLMSLVLGWVVARQVFAAGRITYHRVIGAVLLYLLIALFFVAAFAFVGLFDPNAFQGIKIEDFDGVGQQPDLFQRRHADLDWLRRPAAGPSDRAQPMQYRDDHWSALPGDTARPASDARTRRAEIALLRSLPWRVITAGCGRLPRQWSRWRRFGEV